MTPVDVMAAIFALLVAASVVFALRAVGRRKRSPRQRAGGDRMEMDSPTAQRAKRKE